MIAALISFHVFTSNYHELDWAYHDNHDDHDGQHDHHDHDNNSSWSKSQIFYSKIFSKYFQLAAGLVGWYANASPPALL